MSGALNGLIGSLKAAPTTIKINYFLQAGGGGGGGGGFIANNRGGSGGGAGGKLSNSSGSPADYLLNPGTGYTLVIGAGGLGGAGGSGGARGTTGSNTIFYGPTTLTAPGGGGGDVSGTFGCGGGGGGLGSYTYTATGPLLHGQDGGPVISGDSLVQGGGGGGTQSVGGAGGTNDGGNSGGNDMRDTNYEFTLGGGGGGGPAHRVGSSQTYYVGGNGGANGGGYGGIAYAGIFTDEGSDGFYPGAGGGGGGVSVGEQGKKGGNGISGCMLIGYLATHPNLKLNGVEQTTVYEGFGQKVYRLESGGVITI